jgi:WhiB family transcriptional regulator, redox-sensing transcriptional regulator
MSWQDDALCTEIGVEGFYPEGAGEGKALYNQARRVCAACPVSDACLDTALEHERGLDHSFRHGMWGGKTPTERAALDGAGIAA